jgi:P27 family predicted phage terminase small subunit
MARPRTPTALKLVTGNPGKRPLPENEPKPSTSKKPQQPSHLTARGKVAWKKLIKILDSMGVLTEADGFALERLCDCYAEILELRKDIQTNGRTYESIKLLEEINAEQILMKANPCVAMLQDADRRFKSYLVEFGLTPAARSKVQVTDGQKKKSELDEFFGG